MTDANGSPDERAYEKHAWIFLFVSSAIMLFLSIGSAFSYRKGERWGW